MSKAASKKAIESSNASNSSNETKDMSMAKKYTKMDPRQHVLARPGMYVGSVQHDTYKTYVISEDPANEMMEEVELRIVPALYKIFDEIIVNAIDHGTRLKSMEGQEGEGVLNHMKNIKINIDIKMGIIEVLNDGEGIDIVMHPEHNIFVPEMVFGNLLTSTNYDDSEEKIIGGQNGIGAKACNIFSEQFTIETVDFSRHLSYTQTWSNNMSEVSKPIMKLSKVKPYTKITFLPDYKRLSMPKGLDNDTFRLFKKRCYDVCALTDNGVNVFFNNEKLNYKNFESYVNMYLGTKKDHPRVHAILGGGRWEIVASFNAHSGFEQVSFVNGIWTMRGGKHVDHLAAKISEKLAELIGTKKKNPNVKPSHVKNYLSLFIKSTISNPTFDSQTKDLLTSPVSKFGSKPEITEDFIDKLYKTGIADFVVGMADVTADKQLKKTDGRKQSSIRGIIKLDDANWAGGPKSKECILILTEGDSAKAMAISGLEVVGRDRYGVFPLRGKLLNVKDATIKKLTENEEITNLKKIMGLESGKSYDSIDKLRYGKIMVMTDSDVDGSHIKGLLFNMFQTLWPSLFSRDDFMCSLKTPIVKAKKGKQIFQFYNLTEYENWKSGDLVKNHLKSWDIKYYKGLATSNATEAKDYFKDMKLVKYKFNKLESNDAMDMAFNKKRADDRKEWLNEYDAQNVIDTDRTIVPYEDFVHRDLIHFSKYDLERSIPNICDGLKISQRKIMYCCFKRKLVSEIRVAQLAAYVSEHSAYHHGEASLQSAIIGMAQDFVGSNNINLLSPNGQFGGRLLGGKDAGSPRYIHTQLADITEKIFRPEDNDILTYLDDDGLLVEPHTYYPIIPMILVNGAIGIGTGFSTNIPCFNPKDIVRIVRACINRDPISEDDLVPWYRGHTGTIEEHNDKWLSFGRYKRNDNVTIEIIELPVGVWTEDYKEHLESLLDTCAELKSYTSNYYSEKVGFILHFTSKEALDDLINTIEAKNGLSRFMNLFKLHSSKMSVTNMYLFNEKGQITKYDSPIDIVADFYKSRLSMYKKRRAHQIEKMKYDIRFVGERARFIGMIIDRTLILHDMSKIELEQFLHKKDFMLHEGTYDYLLRMPIYNMTKDKVQELLQELEKLRQKLEIMEKTTSKEMWLGELDELDVALTKTSSKK